VIVALALGMTLWMSGATASVPAAAEPESTSSPSVADEDVPAVSVATMPLLPRGTVQIKQSKGVTAQVRDAIARELPVDVKLLAETKDDLKRTEKCAGDATCLGLTAHARGADLIVTGTVDANEDGLVVDLVAVRANGTEVLRHLQVTLSGGGVGDKVRLERLVRTVVAPHTLQGTLDVTGAEGRVFLDGREVGRLPAHLEHVHEGEHALDVKLKGYDTFHQTVRIKHKDVTAVHVTLLPTDAHDVNVTTQQPVAPLVVASIGAAGVVSGAVVGVFALLTSLDVEKRAKDQQLLFPRDAGLLQRGQILAGTADALYVVGLGALIGGGAWWWTTRPPEETP
jgi:hypothetical protein